MIVSVVLLWIPSLAFLYILEHWLICSSKFHTHTPAMGGDISSVAGCPQLYLVMQIAKPSKPRSHREHKTVMLDNWLRLDMCLPRLQVPKAWVAVWQH